MSRASPRHHQPDGGRVAIYALVSDQSQAEDDKTSLPEQTADMESYCKERGLTIVARYSEVGRGGPKSVRSFSACSPMPNGDTSIRSSVGNPTG